MYPRYFDSPVLDPYGSPVSPPVLRPKPPQGGLMAANPWAPNWDRRPAWRKQQDAARKALLRFLFRTDAYAPTARGNDYLTKIAPYLMGF